MSKSVIKISILLTISLVLFTKLSLALTKPAIFNTELRTQTKRNNEMNPSIPVDAWFQQGMNTFLQLDSAMTKQQFFGNQVHFNYFTLQENPKQFLISFELPGVDPRKIRVSVSQGVLYVQAKNDNKSKQNETNSYYFSYHVALPENANTQKMGAILKRGILQITIEKTNKLASMIDIPVKEIA
jgi:HSP20 family molecular chaperone IbpA